MRRVVTGHDADGRAVVVRDEQATNVLVSPDRRGVALTDLWATPATAGEDPVARPLVLDPPAGGTVFRIVQFEPEDPADIERADGPTAFAAMGAGHRAVSGVRHPYMHRTDTVDYAVVLSGSITMLLDEEDVELHAGDVVVQNGTNHAWANRGDASCRMAFVLIDSDR